MKTTTIHPSTLRTLSTCKLQHHWSRSYRPLTVSEPLTFGTAIHKALEHFYESGKSGATEPGNPVKFFKEYAQENLLQIEGFDKLYQLGVDMLQNYLDEYSIDLVDYTTLATEVTSQAEVPVPHDEKEIPENFIIEAILDTLVRDRRGHIWVMEHKTFSRFHASQLALDHQFVLEAFVARNWLKVNKVPGKVEGVIYNGLRKKAKAPPPLFERHRLYVTDHQMLVALHRVYWQLKQLNSPMYKVYPEPSTMNCSYCNFKRPCEEYNSGGDYQFLLKNLYEKRETK